MKDVEQDMKENQPNVERQESQRVMAIHAVTSFVVALAILLIAAVIFIVLVVTKKEPEKRTDVSSDAVVRVQPIVLSSHRVSIDTQGVVRSMNEVRLATEVGGRVTSKSPRLVEGDEVLALKGDASDEDAIPLIVIAPEDYVAALERAKSALAEAELASEQEMAMAEQAAIDWQKLGRGEPTDLALRVPQIKAARARVNSARAEMERARRDVERTRIYAPFDALVRQVHVEVGAVLAPGAIIAELYSPKQLEVRLPFTLLDYGYLSDGEDVKIQLTATVGGEPKSWSATMDRVDGEVQRSTLSAYGLARLDANNKDLPPVGLFVEAVVPGKELKDVVVLPRSAVRGSNEVWVAQKNKAAKRNEATHRLAKRTITILRASRDEVVARGNFEPGDELVLTRLAVPVSGNPVDVIREDLPNP